MNTYRFFAMVILMNLVLGIAITGYESTQTEDWVLDNNFEEDLYSMQERMLVDTTMYGNPSGDSQTIQEKSVGDEFTMGSMIIKTLWNGVNPLPIEVHTTNEAIEKIGWAINIFILIVFKIFPLIEAIFIFKNRKTV